MELTKEYFDQKLDDFGNEIKKNFATKDDLKNFATKEDLKNFATKDDLKSQTQELKDYSDQQTEKLALIIATSVAEPLDKHLQEFSVAEEATMMFWKKMNDKTLKKFN